MKRSILTWIAVAALITTASICEHLAVINCNYDFAGVEPTWRLLDFDLEAGVQIENVNEIDVIIDRIDMDFFVNDNKVADGEPTFGDTIPAGVTDTLYVTMTISYLDVLDEIVNSIKEGSAAYQLDGTVYFDTRIGEYDFPITITEGEI